MLNKFSEFKALYGNLGNYTKIIIKTTLIFVFTCLMASLFCFFMKDFSGMYIFLYRVSEELLFAARSCIGLGLIFMVIGMNIEK